MREQNIEQALGDLGEFVIEFEVDAGCQQRHAFQQPLDMRILAFVRLQHQARGDFWVFLGEFSAHATQKTELVFVVLEQVVAHAYPFTSHAPRSTFSIESNEIDSGAGSTISNASIWK